MGVFRKSLVTSFCLLFGSFFLSTVVGLAQTNLGQVNGTVYDPSSMPVPNATVTLHSLDTGAERQTSASATGSYVILSIPPARYSLKVVAPGFESYVVPEFLLHVNESRTLDANLTVGTVTQTVEVKASPVALNQTDATIGQVIQQQEIVDLPLNGRNFTELTILAPGVSPVAIGQQTIFMISGGESYSVNGMRHMMNNFTLDGNENNMRFTNSYATPPPPDALSEFKISSHESDSASSLAAGANTNLVLRSGNNTFHGSTWDFLRNNALDANGWFNNYYGAKSEPYRYNQFGFFLGGPVMLPHVLDGRKSGTYFSGYFEGVRNLTSAVESATVPDQAERGGNFSELLGASVGTDCLGRTVLSGQLYDPTTAVANANCPSGVVMNPFPNNTLPAVHSIANAYLNEFYPLPNRSGIPNYTASRDSTLSSNQWGIKIDQNIGDKNTIFGHLTRYNYSSFSPGSLPNDNFNQVNSGENIAGHYTRIFSPSFLVDFLVGYNRATVPYRNAPLGTAWNTLVGDNFAVPLVSGFMPAGQSLGGSRFTSTSFVNYDLANPDTGVDIRGDFKKVHGNHSFNWGMQVLHWEHFTGPQGTATLRYSPVTTGLPGFSSTGEAMASFLLGYPTSSANGFAPNEWTRGNIYVAYGGDTWKVRRNLTVDLGLQYDYASPPIGNQLSMLDLGIAATNLQASSLAFAYLWASTNPLTAAAPNASRGIINPDRNNFAPRVGFAYALNKRMVIRSGVGVFYDYNTNLEQNGLRSGLGYPFSQNRTTGNQNLAGLGPNNPVVSLDNPYGPLSANPGSIGGLAQDINRRDPYAMEWNFGVEEMLPGALKLSVNYVGSGARKLPIAILYNTAPPGTGAIIPRLEWPNVGSPFFYAVDAGTSNYHSLQVEVLRAFAHGFTFRNSYTWGKCTDIESDPNSATDIDSPFHRNLSYGPCDFDVRQNNMTSLVYALPFGRGKSFASQVPGAVNQVIGGWQFSGIINFRTGNEYTILSGQDNENSGNFIGAYDEVAQKVSPAQPTGFKHKGPGIDWINPAAFQVPAFGTIGNSGRNQNTGPYYHNFDLSLMKDFKIMESLKLEFRSEWFNAFNNVTWGNPVNTLASPLFGQIWSANSARIIQFSLKLHW
jgi:hypothetical protein